MTHPTDKPALRRLVRARRDALATAERDAASAAIAGHAVALIAARVPAGATIALYAAKGSEVDTRPLDAALRARGFAIAYPRLGTAGAERFAGDVDRRELTFHVVADREALATSALGIPEPRATDPVVPPAQIAAFAIPGLAFDRTGGRIGYGRGHYDRALAAAPGALRVGLAFAVQLVGDDVPREEHDMPLHAVVTERGVV